MLNWQEAPRGLEGTQMDLSQYELGTQTLLVLQELPERRRSWSDIDLPSRNEFVRNDE
eukprot:TRINITY_DN15087_c0_g1_i1.p3 TRINITY_DN15087_c0_g1~~TRINITY_DN15087_c0_g1_i1.p3  ORF type:complete len:58 (-),score=0.22 TRINITY_DN15087_c0_g1_i1:77-250(-)